MQGPSTSPATLILRLPTTADVFGYIHRRASHRHSFFVRTIIDCYSSGRQYSGCSVDWSVLGRRARDSRERLANIQLDFLHNLISVQSTGRTRSSSLVTLARPPVSSSLGLQITNRSFTYASPHHVESAPFFIPSTVQTPPGSPHPAHFSHHLRSHPITPSTFHSRLKTHLFHKSFLP